MEDTKGEQAKEEGRLLKSGIEALQPLRAKSQVNPAILM
jgi:hypothetical protein